MRKELFNWLKQSRKDLEAAEKSLGVEEYYLVGFLCQQSVEKGLKAVIMFREKIAFVEGHSLIYLASRAKAPMELMPELKKLSPQYTFARYPDLTDEAPYELYDEQIAKEFLKTAKDVMIWIEKQLQ